MKADNKRLSFELNLEQEKTTRHLDDIAAFIERLDKSDKAASKEKSRRITADRQMTDDATTIESLRSQLCKVDSCIEEIRRQAVEAYLKSYEFEAEKIWIFKDENKSYHWCRKMGLDLFVVIAHIRCGYGLLDSSQVVDPLSSVSGDSKMRQVATRADGASRKTIASSRTSGNSPRQDAL